MTLYLWCYIVAWTECNNSHKYYHMTLRTVLSGEDAFEKDLSKSPTLGRGKQGSKMDMMMMMMNQHNSESMDILGRLTGVNAMVVNLDYFTDLLEIKHI